MSGAKIADIRKKNPDMDAEKYEVHSKCTSSCSFLITLTTVGNDLGRDCESYNSRHLVQEDHLRARQYKERKARLILHLDESAQRTGSCESCEYPRNTEAAMVTPFLRCMAKGSGNDLEEEGNTLRHTNQPVTTTSRKS